MYTAEVQVPVNLVFDPILSSSAKLIWMALHLSDDRGPVCSALVERRTGLSRKTILKGLAELKATGWYATVPGRHTDMIERASPGDGVPVTADLATVHIPGELLGDRRVGVRGRILYGCLQLTPQFGYPTGRFTYTSLSSLTGNTPKTVSLAVRELVRTGWLQIIRKNHRVPVQFCLRNPTVERGEAEVAGAGQRLEEAPFLGEALMREYLSLLVESDDFEDDAAPGFLINPWTDERMQLDRYYPPGVAFEFNGPQHYGATDRFSGVEAAR